MGWTPGRERVWLGVVAVWIASLLMFPLLAIFAGQTVAGYDCAVMMGSALVASVFCYGITRWRRCLLRLGLRAG